MTRIGGVVGLVGGVALLLFVGVTSVFGQLVKVGEVAPEISQGAWINSGPLTLQQLKGRVVVVEFWTYG
jgi:hypothetical protein